GKRALHVPEELALEQLVRDRRAVDLDERTLAARAARVDHVRDELLADARFALDQHARARLRDGLEPREHLLERKALADDPAEVHRDLNLLPEVVALALELFPEARVLLERRSKLTLGLIPLRHVLGRDQQRDDVALLVPLGASGQQNLDDLAGLRDERSRLVLELAVRDDVLEPPVLQRLAGLLGHEVRDQPPEDLLPPVAELREPAVADVHDAAFGVDRVQHRRRLPIELAIMRLEARLLAHLGIDGDGTQVVALRAALDDRAREEVDPLPALRRDVERHVVEPAGPPQ